MAVSIYASNQQTKQQLEELDALLQRMLAAPAPAVESMPSDSAQSRTNPEISAPRPAMAAYPIHSPIHAAPVVQPWMIQSPNPSVETMYQQPPLATPIDLPVEAALPEPRFFASPTNNAPAAAVTQTPFPYAMVFGPQPANSSPAAIPPALNTIPSGGIPAPQWAAPKTSPMPPLPVSLWPIYVLNKVFDLLTIPLGPLGSWLRQAGGRHALGWLGVLMIFGAIGWGIADWYGLDWTP